MHDTSHPRETEAKDVFVCSICNNTYDGGKHRPRSMPCGHGFCTLCIESSIAQENRSCPVCRVWHGANSSNKLPVSFLLEELLHKATISTPQKYESDLALENIRVDLLKEKKEAQILTIQKQIQSVMNLEKEIKTLHQNTNDDVNEEICRRQRFEKEVELLLIQIEQSNQEIFKKQKPQEQIQDAIESCPRRIKSMERVIKILSDSTDNQIISQECYLASHEIEVSQEFEETLMKELNLNVDTPCKTANTNSGLQSNDLVMLDSLSPTVDSDDEREVGAFGNDEEDELNLTSATTTTVFLDFTARGINLGRVYVRVLSNRARGKLFVMLALGINGSTLKGANFAYKCSNRIQLMNYVTENNAKSSDLLLPMEYDHYDKVSKGSLYRCASGCFQIWTKNDREVQKGFGYFGYVNAGLEVIDRAASDEFAITDITISESGIVLGY